MNKVISIVLIMCLFLSLWSYAFNGGEKGTFEGTFTESLSYILDIGDMFKGIQDGITDFINFIFHIDTELPKLFDNIWESIWRGIDAFFGDFWKGMCEMFGIPYGDSYGGSIYPDIICLHDGTACPEVLYGPPYNCECECNVCNLVIPPLTP